MKKLILLCSILLCNIILLSNTALGDPDLGYFCIDGNSYNNWTLEGDIYDLEVPCPHGCNPDNGLCYNEDPGSDIAFAMIFIWFAIAMLTVYIAMNLDRETHGLLTVFFMVLSLFSIWNMIGSAYAITQLMNINVFDSILEANTAIWIWVIVLVILYIFVFFFAFFLNLIRGLLEKRRAKKKGDLFADRIKV